MTDQLPIITRIDMLGHPLSECMSDAARINALLEWGRDAKKFILRQHELLAEALYWCDENTPPEVLAKIEACLHNRRIK